MKKVSEQAGNITRKTQKQPAMFKPIACSFHGHVYSRTPYCLEIKLSLLHKLELSISACHGAPHKAPCLPDAAQRAPCLPDAPSPEEVNNLSTKKSKVCIDSS